MENILQIADLTKRYPDFYLDHLTLNVPSGSIVGLIGGERCRKNNHHEPDPQCCYQGRRRYSCFRAR